MKRTLFLVALLGFVGLIGLRLYQQWPAAEAAAGFPSAGLSRSVNAAIAELGPVSQSLTLVGSLRAQEVVEVTPRINGRVVAMHVDLGDAVQNGQMLAKLEDDELRQQEQQSEAALEVARAVINQRELELQNLQVMRDRNNGLREQGLISDQDREQSQTRFEVGEAQLNLARAQLLQSEAGLRELQIRLDQTRVIAPMSGVVGRRFVDVGTLVNAATPVVTLIKLDTVELIANVAERDLVKLQMGTQGRVTVDAMPGETFIGTVARIAPLLDPQTRTARVEIVVPNTNRRLRAEMFARIDLDLGDQGNVLRIPRQALVVRGEQQGVFVISDDIATFREIRVGLTGEDWIEIATGLQPGETVATMGSNLLRDGDSVRVSGAGASRSEEETSA